MLCRIFRQDLEITFVLRTDDSARQHFEWTGIGRIQRTAQTVEKQIPVDLRGQVVTKSIRVNCVHDLGAPGFGSRFQLLLPQSLLPIALRDGEFMWVKPGAWDAPVLATASITHDNIADETIVEQTVNRRGAEQDGPGDPLMIQHLKDEKGRAGYCKQRKSNPLWEILTPIKFTISAECARGQRAAGLSRMQREIVAACNTCPRTRSGQVESIVCFTSRTSESNIQCGRAPFKAILQGQPSLSREQ
jgi:hypothetical protein